MQSVLLESFLRAWATKSGCRGMKVSSYLSEIGKEKVQI